jgi:hypothetical protein
MVARINPGDGCPAPVAWFTTNFLRSLMNVYERFAFNLDMEP